MTTSTGGIPAASFLDKIDSKLIRLSLDVSFPQHRKTSCKINCDTTMSWADLPADILFSIFRLLHDINSHNFLDLYQCLAVCRSWRFVAKQIWRNHVLPTTPWLLQKETRHKIVFSTNLYKWHKFSSLDTDDDSSFSFSLELYPLETHASCNGWLLPGTSDHLPFLYNPVTALLLPLPQLPENLRLHSHMKLVLSRTTPTDTNCITCLKFSMKREFMDDSTTTLAFCRPVLSSSWLTLRESVEDIIFCGEKFYAIDKTGALFVYNDDIINTNTTAYTNWSWRKMKIAGEICGTNSRSSIDVHRCFFYLVESKTGELLMIKRIFEPKHCTYTTESFCVFKLKYRSDTIRSRYNYYYYWDEIHSLHEKESLLLGWNDCISVSVNDDDITYKSNCIYFYDEMIGSKLTAYGMYDLENCTILKKAEDLGMYHCKFFTPSKLSNL